MAYNPVNPNGQATMANSAPVVVASNQSNIPVINAPDTSSIYNGTTQLTPQFALISVISGTAPVIVAAVTSPSNKKIRVISYVLVVNGAVNVSFNSHTFGAKTGLFYLAANGGVSAAYAPTGHFETVAGESLDLSLSTAVSIGGHLTYVTI